MSLTKEQKNRIIMMLHKRQHVNMQTALITINQGLVWAQLHKFSLSKDEEAYSVANEALYKAIMSYDFVSSSFSTYASVCIYNSLGNYVRTLKTKKNTSTISYNAPVPNMDGLTYLDLLEDTNPEDYETFESYSELLDILADCLEYFTDSKSRAIILLWANSDYTMSSTDIAVEIGCTQSYVSRKINQYRGLLRNKLKRRTI